MPLLRRDVGGFAEVIAHVSLGPNPMEITPDTFRERHLRFVTSGPDTLRAAREMAHFSRPEFALCFRRDTNIKCGGNLFRDFPNGHALAATDIDRQAIELVGLGDEEIGARDVFHEREVAGLLAVLIKNGREIVEQARAEDRDHAGVGIEDDWRGP